MDLESAFPDDDGVLCGAFFQQAPASSEPRTWSDLKRLAEADAETFWTIVARHSKLSVVFATLVTAIDAAHSSAAPTARRAVSEDGEQSMVTVLLRLAATTALCRRRNVDTAALAARVEILLPLKVLLPATLLLLRHGGAAAAVVLSACLLLSPQQLCRMPAHAGNWCDGVERLAGRCVGELQRGRYQRLAGDVLSLVEQTYRCVRQLWAALQSAPFLANYMPLASTLRALRLVVDVIGPVLQHFVIVCEALVTHRAVLSRVMAVIVNTAVNAAVTLLLYRTYALRPAEDAATTKRQPQQNYDVCLPALTQATYQALRGNLKSYTNGYPRLLVENWRADLGSLQSLLHYLVPPAATTREEDSLGVALQGLIAPMTNAGDFSGILAQGRQRNVELVLRELVHQGLQLDVLVQRHLLTPREAEQIGGATEVRTVEVATAVVEDEAQTSPEDDSLDPAVSMVRDVFPHFAVPGIRAALSYYNQDVEQFVLDASLNNLPPHLTTLLTTAASVTDTTTTDAAPQRLAPRTTSAATNSANSPTAASASAMTDDYDADVDSADLMRLLGSDMYELLLLRDEHDEAGTTPRAAEQLDAAVHASMQPNWFETTTQPEVTRVGHVFEVDEDMKEKIRMLNALMYEDEYDDDAQSQVDMAEGQNETDDEAIATAPMTQYVELPPGGESGEAPAVPASGTLRGRDNVYRDKQYHAARAKERMAQVADMRAAQPSYTRKKKTTTTYERQGGAGGGGKTALKRALKKGHLQGI